MTNAQKHFDYFESLERTIKIALAVYVFFLLAGSLLLAATGAPELASALLGEPWMTAAGAAVFLGIYALAAYRLGRVSWIGDLHVWLDRKFFGFLLRSNETIFRTLLSALPPGERDAAFALPAEARERMAETIFAKLAGNTHLFPTLLRSGIFQYWIWYWVTNYGTAIFSLLTILTFPFVLAGTGSAARGVFGAFWALAIVHLGMGLWLGNRILRMTREVSESIVSSKLKRREIPSVPWKPSRRRASFPRGVVMAIIRFSCV